MILLIVYNFYLQASQLVAKPLYDAKVQPTTLLPKQMGNHDQELENLELFQKHVTTDDWVAGEDSRGVEEEGEAELGSGEIKMEVSYWTMHAWDGTDNASGCRCSAAVE